MEKIQDVNIVVQHNEDLTGYAIYVIRRRSVPDYRDGQKYVHRKILYALYNDFHAVYNSHTVKTQAIIGKILEKYHPHGDSSVNGAIKPMVNWFEITMPLIEKTGSFGNISGDGAAAPRYTEIKLSQFATDCVISELKEAYNSVDWQPNYDGKYKEPIYLPVAVPLLIINGAMGIAVGFSMQIPKHNLNEVLDATIALIRNPNQKIVLIPDNPMGSDIINTDWEKISTTGRGKYRIRGKMEITTYNTGRQELPALHITTLPDFTYFSQIKKQLHTFIKSNNLPQVVDIVNDSTIIVGKNGDDTEIFNVYIVLKKGSDPNYVREFIYKNTAMQKTFSVNFEVIEDESPILMNYKEYLLKFLEFRRQTKYRMYANRAQFVKTKAHEMYLYILALESGEIDNIIAMIRKQTSIDDAVYIDYLVKKLNVTPLQAKFLLGVDVRKLSIGYLNKYKEDLAKYENLLKQYTDKITIPGELDKEIEQELLLYKKKYGTPRKSKIINVSENNIPEGTFKIVITKNGFVKKIGEHETIGYLNGDEAKFVFVIDNRDNVLVFDKSGKVFKVSVNDIPFAAKGSNGIDLRLVNKYLTGMICSVIPESMLKQLSSVKGNYIYTITEYGYIKRMDLTDFLAVKPSGLIYTLLEDGDMVKDIIFMPDKYDILIYSNNKVLRIKGSEAPYLRRSTRGNRGMDTKYPVDGFSCLYPGATDIVVVTESGKINRVSLHAVPLSARARAGASIIKLAKTDTIKKILVCKSTNTLKIITKGENHYIPVENIPEGSSISSGTKMVSNPIKVELE